MNSHRLITCLQEEEEDIELSDFSPTDINSNDKEEELFSICGSDCDISLNNDLKPAELLQFHNRFTAFELSTDSLSFSENVGLSAFLFLNRRRLTMCWQKSIAVVESPESKHSIAINRTEGASELAQSRSAAVGSKLGDATLVDSGYRSTGDMSIEIDAEYENGTTLNPEASKGSNATVPSSPITINSGTEDVDVFEDIKGSYAMQSIGHRDGCNYSANNYGSVDVIHYVVDEVSTSQPPPKKLKTEIKTEFPRTEEAQLFTLNDSGLAGDISTVQIKLENNYVLPSKERLEEVTKTVMEIVGNNCINDEDCYKELHDYILTLGIKSLSDAVNPKHLVWDVNIRLILVDLLGLESSEKYMQNIETNLNSSSFDDFIEKWYETISHVGN